jgi:hypothetical protein
VCTDVDYTPSFHDGDSIREFQCTQSVCDDDRRPVSNEIDECFMNQSLTFQVDLARRLIQN